MEVLNLEHNKTLSLSLLLYTYVVNSVQLVELAHRILLIKSTLNYSAEVPFTPGESESFLWCTALSLSVDGTLH